MKISYNVCMCVCARMRAWACVHEFKCNTNLILYWFVFSSDLISERNVDEALEMFNELEKEG